MTRLMNLKPLVMLIGLSLAAAPALAAPQHERGGGTHEGGRAVPRAEGPRGVAPRGVAPRAVAPRVVVPRTVGPRFVGPSVRVSPFYRSYYQPFYRPFYTFRPRLSIGFGLWAGYPVVYPYAYAYPEPYPYPYSYPSAGAVTVGPPPSAEAAVGGLSFEIEPDTAEVYADGQDVGPTANFSPNMQPLSLAPGRHHIEVRAPGYQTIGFDADVLAGQVIPYQGTMQRQ